MHDSGSIKRINQVARTRRIAFGIILLALALPSLFAWSGDVALESAGGFTAKLVVVTLIALIVRLWMARHYSAGVQAQVLLAFALILVGWSGYVSRTAHEARVSAKTQTGSAMPALIPGQAADPALAPAAGREVQETRR